MKPLWRDDPLADFEDAANLSETAEQVLRDAARLAAERGAHRTGTAHLLLALLGDERAARDDSGEGTGATTAPVIPADALAALTKAGATRQHIRRPPGFSTRWSRTRPGSTTAWSARARRPGTAS